MVRPKIMLPNAIVYKYSNRNPPKKPGIGESSLIVGSGIDGTGTTISVKGAFVGFGIGARISIAGVFLAVPFVVDFVVSPFASIEISIFQMTHPCMKLNWLLLLLLLISLLLFIFRCCHLLLLLPQLYFNE